MTVRLDLDAPVAESSTRKALLDISLSVAKCKKIVVVTGAGISCSCGIPDFRSSDGLYALVKQQHPDVVLKGRDLFDASLFRDKISTAVFYTFISQLKHRIDSATPAPTHRFIKILDAKQKLLRSYTQNIDGFEEKVGLRSSSSQQNASGKGKSRLRAADVRNIQLHGDIHRVRCTLCAVDLPCTEDHLSMFNQGMAPDCPECRLRLEARLARSARPLKIGSLRPAIVLYDEAHPLGDDIGLMQTLDIARKPDMLIIMGTSLKVHGLKKLVKDFAKAVHMFKATAGSTKRWQGKVVFVNKTAPGSEWEDVFDYHVSGETDCWVEKVLEDWKKMRPSDWEVQQTLDVDGLFKSVKESAPAITQKKFAYRRKSLGENVCRVTLPLKSSSSVPSSAVKRRQSGCHYSDVESSPRKRRGMCKTASYLEETEMARRLLFLDTTNSTAVELDSPIVQSPRRSTDCRPRSRTLSTGTSVKTPRMKKVWVEIKKTNKDISECKLAVHV